LIHFCRFHDFCCVKSGDKLDISFISPHLYENLPLPRKHRFTFFQIFYIILQFFRSSSVQSEGTTHIGIPL
jgi:hypothetical protein